MFQKNSQKIIIVSLVAFLLASFIFLAYIERQQHQLSSGWSLYFENPKDTSLDFTIENYTSDSKFEWRLSVDGDLIKSEKIIIKNKEKEIIKVDNNNLSGKVEIEVEQKNNKKGIYKIIH